MFCVLYTFQVRPGKTDEFIAAWKEMTLLISKHAGGLGSRLHKSNEEIYIAYAQWPDEKTWEGASDKLPESASEYRLKMGDSCEVIETSFMLDVVEDLLVN